MAAELKSLGRERLSPVVTTRVPESRAVQRKVIRNGNFTSRDGFITKREMPTYIAAYDEKAKSFKWTYARDPLNPLVA